MDQFAFIRWDDGRYLCGEGPFVSSAELPSGVDVAFYRNNFELSDPEPWKVPTRHFETDDLGSVLAQNGATPLPEIAWSGLGDTDVRGVFDEILQRIESGELKKSVPVLAERGILHRGEPMA